MKIVVATHNEGKLVEIRNILTEQLSAAAQGIELVSAGSLDLADPAETGVTFEENALLKARFVADATGLPFNSIMALLSLIHISEPTRP